MADATLEALTFSSRAMASAAAARYILWLRAWQVDILSKHIVAYYLSQGDWHFGHPPDKILMKTYDKKKAVPKILKRTDRRSSSSHFFCSQQTLPSFKQESKKANWTSSNHSQELIPT